MQSKPYFPMAVTGAWCLIALVGIVLVESMFSPRILTEAGTNRLEAHLRHVTYTLARALFAFTATALIALAVSVGLAYWRPALARGVEVILGGFRSLPALAWLPFTVKVVGVKGLLADLLFVGLGILPQALIGILAAINSCPNERLIVAQLSTERRGRIFVRVVLPSAIEPLFQMMRTVLALALILEIVHEYFVTPEWGVGRILNSTEILAFSTADALAYVVLLLGMGMLLDQLNCLIVQVIAWAVRRSTETPDPDGAGSHETNNTSHNLTAVARPDASGARSVGLLGWSA